MYVTSVLALSYVYAKERINVCDYVSINGDFQSYNVFRRILDHQKPYYDFANYIGMAPVMVNMPFMIFDGSFANSLFVTTFTSNVLFCIAVMMVCMFVTQNFAFSATVSVFIPKIITSKLLLWLLGAKYGYIWNSRFEGLFTPSNSMRGTRSFLPFLLIIISACAMFIYNRRKEEKVQLIDILDSRNIVCITGFVQGFFIVWSNDFGLSCIASMIVLYAVLQIVKYRRKISEFLLNLLLYAITVTAGLLTSATLITGLHPTAWFDSVYSTAEYQFFYFNGTAGKAIIPYIFSQPTLWFFTFIMIAVLLYYLHRLIKGARTDRDLYAVFVVLAVSAATYAYICSGSGYNFREAIEVYAVLFIISFAARIFFALTEKYSKIINALMLCALCGGTVLYSVQAATFQPQITGTYIEQLGGTNTQTVALIDARQYTGDEEVFSMYATGLEVMKNQFQPTGYDYIIHVLGQEAQRSYAQKFITGDYKYVQTPSMEIGSWLAQQNWYVYRHLMADYTMVFQTEYSFIWEKTDSQRINADVQVEIHKLDDSRTKIICTSENTDTFVADLSVNYSTEFDSLETRLLCLNRKAVMALTTCCGYDSNYYGLAMPAEGSHYIPVKMENGKGEAVLKGVYGKGINLDIHSAKYIQALPAFMLSIETTSLDSCKI